MQLSIDAATEIPQSHLDSLPGSAATAKVASRYVDSTTHLHWKLNPTKVVCATGSGRWHLIETIRQSEGL
jgi:hypothetical protein